MSIYSLKTTTFQWLCRVPTGCRISLPDTRNAALVGDITEIAIPRTN